MSPIQPITFSRYLLPTELQQNLNEPNEPNEQAEEAINEVVAINSCVNDGRYAITSDKIEDDSTNKDYLTEEESLSFDPLTDVMNVASMRQSILKIIGST